MKEEECQHKSLITGSGGYYLICQQCHERWKFDRTNIKPIQFNRLETVYILKED